MDKQEVKGSRSVKNHNPLKCLSLGQFSNLEPTDQRRGPVSKGKGPETPWHFYVVTIPEPQTPVATYLRSCAQGTGKSQMRRESRDTGSAACTPYRVRPMVGT